jgi:hypothetical protein
MGEEGEGVGVMKDKELKLEEIEASRHALGGALRKEILLFIIEI